MDSLDLAIHSTAHGAGNGGLPLLAKQMGIGEQSLRNKVGPTNEVAKLSVQEARSMMMITGDRGVLDVLAHDLGYKVVAIDVEQANVLDAMLKVVKEQGDVAAKIIEAMTDGKITPRERHDVERELSEASSALEVLRKAVHALSDGDGHA